MQSIGYRKPIFPLILLISILLLASASGGFDLQFGVKGSEPGELGPDIYISVAPDGNIYVSDPFNRRVQVFDQSGKIISVVKPERAFAPGFEKLGEIAANSYGFYVVDEQFLSIPGSENFYIHTSVIHQFDSLHNYVRTITVDSLDIGLYRKFRLTPALGPKGKIVYSIMDILERPFHIATDEDGSLYVLDERKSRVYVYNRDGELSLSFGRLGFFDEASDIDVDRDGNIYVADRLNNSIVKFDETGKRVLSMGKRGTDHGEFIKPHIVSTTDDGKIIVKDISSCERIFESYLPSREDEIVPGEERRKYSERIERIQIFNPDGSFLKEIPIRFDLSDPDRIDLSVIDIDRNGRILFYDVKKHTVKVDLYNSRFRWKDVRKSYTLRFEKDVGKLKVDSSDFDDLFDYLDSFNFRILSQSFLVSYSMSGRTSVHSETKLSALGAYRDYLYPGERIEENPLEEAFENDYFLIDNRIEGETEFGLDFILDPNYYTYRELNLSLSIRGALHKFHYYTFSNRNLSHALQDLWEWGTRFGINLDLKKDLNLFVDFVYTSPKDFMNYRYRYWDQYGVLTYTSSYWGKGVTAVMGLNAVF